MQQFDNVKLADYTAVLRKKYVTSRRVSLIQSPQFLLNNFNLKVAKGKGCYAYPPTGLQCIAKALSGRNLEIDIFDLNYFLLKRIIQDETFDYRNWLEILDEYLERETPSIVGVTSINVYSDVFKPGYPLTSILEHLRNKGKYLIIAGGPIAASEYHNYLAKDLCHFVVTGEGENKINFLFDYLFDCRYSQKPMRGIYFKFNDRIEETSGHPDSVTLEGNLIRTYNSVPIEDYNNIGSLNPYSRMTGQERHFSAFQLVRGCRANCKFCGVSEFMGKGVRHFPVTDLLDEIIYLVEERGIRHFDVLDDDFLVNQRVVTELLKALVKLRKKYKITWSSNNGLVASSINEDLMMLMRDSGCVGFRIGIESGNAEMLKRMKKPVNLPLVKKIAEILNKFPEIFTGGNYIIGLLGEETFGEMLTTFRLSCELNLDWASFAIFQFTSKLSADNSDLKEKEAQDFIPTKDASNRQILDKEDIVSGPDVFSIAEDAIPSREQIKQIWFTFNLVSNYINNKNLKPSGRPEKFVSWVEAVNIAYPDNPYMSLFAGIGHVLLGNKKNADRCLQITKNNLMMSKYWDRRFRQFEMDNLLTNFTKDAGKMQKILETLRSKYHKWIRCGFSREKEVVLDERI